MNIFAAIFILFTQGSVHAQIRLTETGGGTDYISLQAPAALAANLTWTLPTTDGSANQCLATNGSQTLQWYSSGGSGYSLNANGGSPANVVYVDAAGKVGVGTTAPTAGTIMEVVGIGTSASAIMVPRDTTANRPATGVNGMIRYNTTTNKFETYQNGGWLNVTGGLMGKLDWPGTAGCAWSNAATPTYANYAADAQCPSPTVIGGATAPGTLIPAITINNLPAGDYEVVAVGHFAVVSGVCRYRLYDGTNASGILAMNNILEGSGLLTGIFSYASAGTRTFHLQPQENSGIAGGCTIENTSPTLNKFEMWVRRL